MTVRVSPGEEEVVKQLADDLGISISDVFRRALGILAAEGDALIAREEAEREAGAELLARIHELGHLKDDEALQGHSVSIEAVESRRVVVRWAGHTFQRMGDRIAVGRRRLDGTTEVAWLDGEPDVPDVARYFEQRVLT